MAISRRLPQLATEAVRRQFPGLNKGSICLNNGAGSLVYRGAIESITKTMSHPHMNLRGQDSTSMIDVKQRAAQYAKIASFVNADPDEIVLCHEAGITAWRSLAKSLGIVIKWWTPPTNKGKTTDPKLTLESLQPLLSPKTRLVCCGHVSNITGTIEPIKDIADLVHTIPGAMICVDGVAMAPHRPIDVKLLDVDFYVFSWYKVFGPHIAQIYARRRVQQRFLTSLNHYFFDANPLSVKLGLGNSCIELEHAVVPIINYLEDQVGWESIIGHEQAITTYLLEYLTSNPDLYTVYGSQSSDPNARVSLVSFSTNGLSSDRVAQEIHETSAFYDVLGRGDDGIIRASLVHYNTMDEMRAFTQTLDQAVRNLTHQEVRVSSAHGMSGPQAETSKMNGNSNGHADDQPIKKHYELSGCLDKYDSFKVGPVIGTEFPSANVAEWMRAENSDELIRELAITISQRGVVFFRAQKDFTNELQKELADRLGRLTGKPESSTLHIHPLHNFNPDEDKHINTITTDKQANPAEDLWKNRPSDIRNSWHTDAGYEPNPPDYSILKLVKLPETGGDTMWASSCEIYDKISPSYRKFLESLTATFSQTRLPRVAKEKGFELYTEPRGSPNNIGDSLTSSHPVVRTNPVTGWKSLFAVGNHAERINDVTSDESKRLLDWFLQLIVEEHDCQLRHQWKNPYDVAIWDNRTVYHTAIFDFAGFGARTGHRAVGIGERPYFDPMSKTRREALAGN
ncbi:hypothetical protein HG530_006569 [Fusarium avenaceum]|nr:hypothetical protein HG530_006569 [Fusarium avenaceum]